MPKVNRNHPSYLLTKNDKVTKLTNLQLTIIAERMDKLTKAYRKAALSKREMSFKIFNIVYIQNMIRSPWSHYFNFWDQ